MIAITAITAGVMPMDARASDGWAQTRTKRYLVGDAGPMRDMPGQVLTFPTCTLGSLCFGNTIGDTFTVSIRDDSGRIVGGVIVIDTFDRRTLSYAVCGRSRQLPVVPGTLAVHLDAPGDVRGRPPAGHWFGGPGRTEIRPLGTTTGATTQGATSGRVRVTFTTHDR